jgi:phage shock protein E
MVRYPTRYIVVGMARVTSSLTRTLAALALAATLGLAACSSTSEPRAGAEAPAAADTSAEQPSIVDEVAGRTIIDVRTPDEYAAGHLEGSVNIDVQAPTFEDEIAQLPTDGSYLLYCRSGNRSAAAAAQMAALGFTDVVDGGAFDALVAAGMPTA